MSIAKVILSLCTFSIIIFLNVAAGLAQGPVVQGPPPPATPAFAPGEIVVKFQPNVGRLGAQSSLRAEGLRLLETAPGDGLLRVQVTPGREAQAIADLLARGDVEYATFNYHIEALGDPNDLYYNSQWALNNTGQTGGTPDADINAPEAWNLHTGSSSVVIAVIDTGVDLDHPDLAAKITSGSQAGYNYITPGSPPDDDNNHGSHVAGIAAASTNNGIGIAGVSWGAEIMPLKILDSAGSGGTYNLSLAIKYAADHGAKVINMSLGGGCGSGWPDVEEAVNYAVSKGVVLVAASGNVGSSTVYCPAAINGVIAVGATDSGDVRAYYSNYGLALDVVAPGSSIYSTIPGGYGYKSGTSMASPHVAGLAALLRSFAPSLTPDQVQSIIQNTTDDLGVAGWDQYYGYGRINAWHALETIILQPSPAQPVLLLGDNQPSTSGVVRIITTNSEDINWTAAISPTVDWLQLSPPAMGTVSAASTDQYVVLNATLTTSLPTYGVYTATLVLTGTTASGVAVGPITTEVRVQYVEKVYGYYMPFIFED